MIASMVLHYAVEGGAVRLVHIPSADVAGFSVHEDTLAEPPFDLALYALLLRGFPLEPGASFRFPILAFVPGQGVALLEEILVVVDSADVGYGQARALVVETQLRPWTVWLVAEPPYIARLEQRLPDGTRWISVPRARG